jgi:hypothetical protein
MQVILRLVCVIFVLSRVHSSRSRHNDMSASNRQRSSNKRSAALGMLGATSIGLAAYLGFPSYTARKLTCTKPLAIACHSRDRKSGYDAE